MKAFQTLALLAGMLISQVQSSTNVATQIIPNVPGCSVDISKYISNEGLQAASKFADVFDVNIPAKNAVSRFCSVYGGELSSLASAFKNDGSNACALAASIVTLNCQQNKESDYCLLDNRANGIYVIKNQLAGLSSPLCDSFNCCSLSLLQNYANAAGSDPDDKYVQLLVSLYKTCPVVDLYKNASC